MRTSVVAFAISLLVGMVLTRAVRDLAIKYGWYDQPGNRKIHVRPTPRLGGLAVVLGFLAPLAGLFLYNNPNYSSVFDDPTLWLALASGGGLMFLVGLVDDFRGLRPVVKLMAQIAAGGFVFACGIQIDAVQLPFVGMLHLGYWALPITVFWMVLVTNAVNLIDGMDGLAGGVVVLGGGTLFLMSLFQGNAAAAVILAALVGATLGFLVFNLNPASIFLGDAGSLFLGFSLGLIAIHSNQKSSAFASILSAMLVLGLPIFDLTMTVIRRLLMRRPIFSADQHHVHHLLLRSGLSQRQSVGVLLGTAAVLEVLALSFVFQNDSIAALVLAIVVVLIAFAVHKLGYRELIYRARVDIPPVWANQLAAAVAQVQPLRSALHRTSTPADVCSRSESRGGTPSPKETGPVGEAPS